MTHPECADLPQEIRFQFVTGWPSGYGLVELAEYLNVQAALGPNGVNVLRFYYWSPPYQGLDLYVAGSESLALHTLDPSSPDLSARVNHLAANRRTLLVLNPPIEADHLQSLDKDISTYLERARRVWYCDRPGGNSGLEVWEVDGAGRNDSDVNATPAR